MARQQVERLMDDLDGSEAAETVSFGLDGVTYEIDLSKKNAAGLRRAMARYIDAGRTTGPAGRRRSAAPAKKKSQRPKAPGREYEIADLREWAGLNDIRVPARGRIPRAVVEQYLSATS